MLTILRHTQVVDHLDNISEDSSVDAYSLSEVSFDDASPSRVTLAVTRVTAPQSTLDTGASHHMAAGAPTPVTATVSTNLPSLSVQYHGNVAGHKGGGVGGGGEGGLGGGLFDATRSSAVSSMLQSAKQKQLDISDGSEDDWDE